MESPQLPSLGIHNKMLNRFLSKYVDYFPLINVSLNYVICLDSEHDLIEEEA